MWAASAFEGVEFDWFAVDAVGHIGHFSTAGWGPVPLRVLDRLDAAHTDALWSLGKRLLELPVVGQATGHRPGRMDDWLELARRGLFCFDWQQNFSGPYQRIATPSIPVRAPACPPSCNGWFARSSGRSSGSPSSRQCGRRSFAPAGS